MTRNREITNFMQVISLDTLPLRRRRVGSWSVAEILIHIAFFSNFDYLFHEEDHVTAVEAFDFGQFLNDSESQETIMLHRNSMSFKTCSRKSTVYTARFRYSTSRTTYLRRLTEASRGTGLMPYACSFPRQCLQFMGRVILPQ